ncbi:MAG TPA: ABC transporter permease [Terracidiphilus sp.]|nr:ABC transporter permease [Terracidiphilus sp.]
MSITSHIHSSVARIRSFLRALIHRNRLEREMETELGQHVAARTDDLIDQGMVPQEAARRAKVELGPVLMHKGNMRASLGLRLFDELTADVRHGLRLLAKSPGFTLIAALSLALAIGANTTIFSVAKQLLYERLAVPHAANLRLLSWTGSEEHVAVHHVWGDWDPLPDGRVTSTSFSYLAYKQLRAQNHVLQDLFALKDTGVNLTVRDQALRGQIEMVSGNYYAQLGVKPQLGRAISPADDTEPGQGAVAIISDGLWERRFGRSSNVLGQVIKVNDTPFTIVGVNPRGFTGARNVQQSPEVFAPLSMQPLVHPATGPASPNTQHRTEAIENPNYWWVMIMGRARPGVSNAAAQAALNTQLSAIVRATMPVRKGEDLPRMDLRDGSRGLFTQERMFAKPMAVLMTLVGFVLLLACANVANLMLARGAQRQREMSVRLALGAGRVRILRQMLVESLLLAGLGGAGGLLVGYFGRNVLPRMTENAWERTEFHVAFDWKVFAFTAAITIATGIAFGLAPAFAAARAEVTHGLKETARTATRRRSGMGGKSLVGVQIALSTLLVIGAGLFLRTLASLNAMSVGFKTDHLLLVGINPPEKRYPAGADIALHQRLEQAFAAIPGVESATAAQVAYVSNELSDTDFLPAGESFQPNAHQVEDLNVVGTDFFQTMGIPILAGRGFGPQDTATSEKVAVINEALVRKRFPGQNPVGKRFRTETHDSDGFANTNPNEWIRIVGVCGNTRYTNLRQEPPAQFILPYVQQKSVGGMTYELRTRLAPDAIVPALRKIVQNIDPDLPLVDVRTQDEQIAADTMQERLFVTLTSGFGLLALALAAVGIYGVMSYSVSQRRSEIGIRLALGAVPSQVRGMVLRESTWIAMAGIAAGMGGAILLTRLVKSMLYGIAPNDPLTLAAGGAVLLLVALVSSWIPARRAARVQPMEALRHE